MGMDCRHIRVNEKEHALHRVTCKVAGCSMEGVFVAFAFTNWRLVLQIHMGRYK